MTPQTTNFKKYHRPCLKNYYNYNKKWISSQYALVITKPSTASLLEAVTFAIKRPLNRKFDVDGSKNLKILTKNIVGVIVIYSCLHEHLLLFNYITYNLDVAEACQLSFQDSASPIMQEIVNFHH